MSTFWETTREPRCRFFRIRGLFTVPLDPSILARNLNANPRHIKAAEPELDNTFRPRTGIEACRASNDRFEDSMHL